MAKPNYKFAKRQRDLAKKKKNEEKQRRKTELREQKQGTPPEPPNGETPTPDVPGNT